MKIIKGEDELYKEYCKLTDDYNAMLKKYTEIVIKLTNETNEYISMINEMRDVMKSSQYIILNLGRWSYYNELKLKYPGLTSLTPEFPPFDIRDVDSLEEIYGSSTENIILAIEKVKNSPE